MAANAVHGSRSGGLGGRGSKRRRLGVTLALTLTAVYLVFLALVIYAPAAMSTRFAGNLTPGLALGAATILIALGLGVLYIVRANREERNAGVRP